MTANGILSLAAFATDLAPEISLERHGVTLTFQSRRTVVELNRSGAPLIDHVLAIDQKND